MADQLQLRRGTSAQIAAFTGAQGEVVVNTTNYTLSVHDGITPGGRSTASTAQVTNGTFYYNEDVGSAANAYVLVPKNNTNVPTAYQGGIQFGFVSAHPNTGASTANFQGLGVKNLKYSDGTDPAAGDISGRIYFIYDDVNDWMEIQRKATAAQPQLRTIGASVATSALTVTFAPGIVDFRAASLGSGTVNRRNVVSTLSLTVPSGATLGTISTVESRIAVVALDNAGTPQLGVVNMAGSVNLDETTLVNCTAITSGSSSANVIYSTSSASNLPFRVLGFVQSTQATAGTWATTPSEIQGQGGQALLGFSKMILALTQATTSGTSIDFTGIPSWVRRITVMLNQVSTNGISNLLLQLGAGAAQSTGYICGGSIITTTVTTSSTVQGFIIPGANASNAMCGSIAFNNIGGNIWIGSSTFYAGTAAATLTCAGIVAITGAVDRIRLTTVNGTDVFDAGSINISYEG